eukprot:scaffold7529_cov143-Isochrysis_galbana.AAC.6
MAALRREPHKAAMRHTRRAPRPQHHSHRRTQRSHTRLEGARAAGIATAPAGSPPPTGRRAARAICSRRVAPEQRHNRQCRGAAKRERERAR